MLMRLGVCSLKIGIEVSGGWRRAAKFAGEKQLQKVTEVTKKWKFEVFLRALRFLLFKIF
jgi:hypothetical protein